MANFEIALAFLLRDEDQALSGIVTPEPNGGKARFGINSVCNPDAVTDGFYEMPRSQALEYAGIFYRWKYYKASGCEELTDQNVVNLFFDLAVNMGITEATRVSQRACNRVVFDGKEPFLAVDGLPGQRTIDAMNLATPSVLVGEIKNYAAQFYRDLAARHPEKYPATMLEAWLKRLSR